MSWLCQHPEIRDDEWGLLGFSPSPNEALLVSKTFDETEKANDAEAKDHGSNICAKGQTKVERLTLLQETEWEDWLHRGEEECRAAPLSSIRLILCNRTSSLENLPVSRSIFSKVKTSLRIHRSIIRAINRNTSCTFSSTFFGSNTGSNADSIVYNCRTAASWDGDMALSVTFCPKTLMTNALWFGCQLTQHDIHGYVMDDAELISRRLLSYDGDVLHPMLLPTIFADMERDRQIGFVRENLTQLVQRVFNLAYAGTISREDSIGVSRTQASVGDETTISLKEKVKKKFKQHFSSPQPSFVEEKSIDSDSSPSSSLSERVEPSAILWIKISDLRNGLQNWRTNLLNMIVHVDELNDRQFGIPAGSTENNMDRQHKLKMLQETGARIKIRLLQLVDEYDEFIRRCTHIMDGMTLATQLELNNIGRNDAKTNLEISQTNLKVAQMARQDGSVMKSIALLGMIFLPGTFVSSFFSMSLFKWTRESDERMVSPYFWVYLVTAGALTFITMVVFYFLSLRRKPRTFSDMQLEV